MCDHQWSPSIERDSGQVIDSSVNSGNKNVFIVVLKLHKLSVLYTQACTATTNQNTVERLANQNHVNCLFDVISQTDMSSFLQSREKDMLRAQRAVRNGETKMLF